MREVIQLQVGQCGNKIGEAFWNTIRQEHAIDSDGSSFTNATWTETINKNIFFKELQSGRHVARSVFTDLDPSSIHQISAGPLGKLFNPENLITSSYATSSSNIYAVGRLTQGAEILDQIMDSIRREAETCDSLHGFQLVQSVGGGTGSGLGSLLTCQVRDEYPTTTIFDYVMLPSPTVSESLTETYNAVLAICDCCPVDVVPVFDNEAITKICTTKLGITRPQYPHINQLVATVMSNVSASFRFPGGSLNSDLRKIAVNLIPYCRIRFVLPGLSPVDQRQQHTTSAILEETFACKNFLASTDEKESVTFGTASALFRGNFSNYEVESFIRKFHDEYRSTQYCWLEEWIKYSICPVTPPGYADISTLLANSGSICSIFRRLVEQFQKLFSKKAFLHKYIEEGMDEMEFNQSFVYLAYNIMGEYQTYLDNNEHDLDPRYF